MSLKNQYPIADGWLHMKLTLTSATPISPEALKKLCTLGNPDDYEVPHLVQNGRVVTMVSREKGKTPSP